LNLHLADDGAEKVCRGSGGEEGKKDCPDHHEFTVFLF
jgi:hypothetical protein